MLRYQLQPGDIIAFYGTGFQSRVIEWVTFGPSHVGIVAEWDVTLPDGTIKTDLVLVESTTLCEHYCLHTRRLIRGVQVQWPSQRIEDYEGRAKLFRLTPDNELTRGQSRTLTTMLRHLVGTSYDLTGALWSGSRILKYIPWFGYSDRGTLFCSELIAKCLMKFGLLPLGNPGWYNPGSLLRTLLMCHSYQRGIPL